MDAGNKNNGNRIEVAHEQYMIIIPNYTTILSLYHLAVCYVSSFKYKLTVIIIETKLVYTNNFNNFMHITRN